jgi:uncharacterized protein YigE (DUF2233 family)
LPKSRLGYLLLLLILCPLFLSGAGMSASGSPWQKIEEGFEARVLIFNGQQFETNIKIQALRIDPEKFSLRVIDSRAFGVDMLDVKALAEKSQALAVINGGFFLPDFRPLGLLIVDGKETNPLRRVDWGIFLIQENSPRIIHTSEFLSGRSVSQALQVGPRLVVNGRELRLKRQVARRSAVGVNFKNQVILINTVDTEAYAQDLAKIFFLPESAGGLECRDALALDGGPSAQMFAGYKSLNLNIPGGWPVPNGIGVFKKER